MSRFSPFKFLDAYAREDASIFFGRKEETDALYQALSGVKHLLVYGPSGAGKTSLIECGLRNQFSDADWFALTIRRGADINASVFARINEALQEPIPLGSNGLPEDPALDFGQAVEQLFAERYQPVYLLFDQFEELLLRGGEEEKTAFFTRINRLIRYKIPCRILFVMREEFIGHLSEFEPLCPTIFQHRFRLEKMPRSRVKEVITQMISAPEYATAFSAEAPGALADAMLGKLPDDRREIDLAHVQVFLSELWDKARTAAAPSSLPRLHAGLIGEKDRLEDVLDSFLKKQLAELEQEYGKNVPLEVLATMISERHTKLQVSETEIAADLEKKTIPCPRLPELLRALETRRILRSLRSGERVQHELSHDVLASVVGQNLTEEMKLRQKAEDVYAVYADKQGFFSQEDLDQLRPYQAYLPTPPELAARMTESERRLIARQQQALAQARRRTRTLAGFLMLALVALAGAGYFWWEAGQKEQMAQSAASAAKAAETKATTALEANIRQQKENTAQELLIYGDQYRDLGKETEARETYQAALDTLKTYPNTPLYQEIHQRLYSPAL